MNKIVLMGRLTKAPEMRYSQGENATCITRFDIAVSRRFTKEGQPDADFFTCVAFGKTGEFVSKYFNKGMRILVDGSLQNNNYEKDGVKHYSNQIVVENVEFCESKAKDEGSKQSDGYMSVPTGIDDELPFA